MVLKSNVDYGFYCVTYNMVYPEGLNYPVIKWHFYRWKTTYKLDIQTTYWSTRSITIVIIIFLASFKTYSYMIKGV